MQKISRIKKIILSGLMLALSLVLSRFLSIKTPLLVISLNFVPLMLSAIWLGPKYCAIIAGLSDFIGAILFPHGEYFVGFTVSAVILGVIYGLILHKKEELSKKELIIRLVIASVVGGIVVNLGLNTLWLMIMYDKAFLAVVSTRVVKEIILVPIQVVVMFALVQALKPVAQKYLFEEE